MPCGHSEVVFTSSRPAGWTAARAAGQAAGWAVERAARLEAARREAARRRAGLAERADELSEELSKAAGRWQKARQEHGADFPAWPHGEAPPDTAGMQEDELEAVIGDLRERIAKARREYVQQSALFTLRTSMQAASQDARAAASAAQEEAAQREERDRRRCAEEVSRLLDTLEAEVSNEDRTAVEQRAQEAVESPRAARRRALLSQLRLDIQRANAAGAARQRMAEQAEQWRKQLLEVEGPEVEELDAALRQVADGEAALPADMAQRVEGVAARAAEASDREYALVVMREELENLGYVVETGSDAALARESQMLLRKPDMEEDYHVLLWTKAGVLNNRVVREESAPGPRNADRERTDEQMEAIWWQDLATSLAAAEQRGVQGRVTERMTPGRVPVRTIAPLKSRPESKSESRPGRKRRRTGQMRSRSGR